MSEAGEMNRRARGEYANWHDQRVTEWRSRMAAAEAAGEADAAEQCNAQIRHHLTEAKRLRAGA